MAKPGKHTVGGGRVVHPKGSGPWLLPPPLGRAAHTCPLPSRCSRNIPFLKENCPVYK